MANVLHRVNKQYLKSVNTPDYPTTDWIINPDLSAVEGWPRKYWEVNGDTVGLMNPAKRNAVDAQMLSDARDSVASEMDELEGIFRAFALVVLDEINLLRAQHSLAERTISQLKTAVRNKLGS